MSETISRLAFSMQDETTTRLEAQRFARTVLALLRPGDEIGHDLIVQRATLFLRGEIVIRFERD